jgi:adenine-specific DNA-methyltransferase
MGNKFMPPKGRSWQFGLERYNELVADNRIWFGKDGMNVPRIKKFLSDVKEGIVPRTIWLHDEAGHNDAAKRIVKELLPEATFDTPKPPSLIERVLQIGSGQDSIILDSFAGSGTTAHAVLNLNKQDGGNRKFILVEMEDYAETITAERVRRVMNGYPSAPLRAANPKKATPGTGGSFSYYTLGPRLFDEHHNLNEEVGLEKIREYVWYTETRTELPASNAGSRGGDPAGGKKKEAETPYFLGKHEDTAYYFVYEKERLTVLDYDTLALLKTKAGHYVIYADNCVLPQAFLETHGITFKKIPRDITRF